MKTTRILLRLLSVVASFLIMSCSDRFETQTIFSPDNPDIHYTGRIDFTDPVKPKLSNAGAYFVFTMRGTSCTLILENESDEPDHNYISVAVDGHYLKRIRINKDTNRYLIAEKMTYSVHTILVCKATDPFIGYIELRGIQCRNLLKTHKLPERKVEFIGNSITSGAEMDTSLFGCDSGVWHDRHNAYLAYGPVVCRSLQAQWLLSSISGMGLTRNWNNAGPGVPAFYDNLYLNSDSTKPWPADRYIPDLITICLGTNDNSPGDGSYDRKPLDSATFVSTYVKFVNHVRSRYPKATICLLNSPVFSAKDREKFNGYLEAVANTIKKGSDFKAIYSFTFKHKYHRGCSGHPNVEEQQQMADELRPFLKEIMGW